MKDAGRSFKTIRRIFKGIDSMIQFVDYNHPTACIFKREAFAEIPNCVHYFEISDMYPEVYVIRDLLLKGNGASISSGLYYFDFVIDKSKIKSTVEHDVDIYTTYFAPSRRTLQFYEFIDMIEPELSGLFTEEELNRYFARKFNSLLDNVSRLWYLWLRDPVQMAHYGQSVRYVTISEMVQNILNAYYDTKTHLKEKGIYTPAKEEIMSKEAVKAIFYSPFIAMLRYYTKKAFAPLGIWKIMRFLRAKFHPFN